MKGFGEMYLHIGQGNVVKTRDIVGIFDLDTTTVKKVTRDYLSFCEKEKRVVTVSNELPKSFVLCDSEKNCKKMVYLSPISSVTLSKRTRKRGWRE